MFSRVLVANRGEIAIRIIHACRELGIESVAVFSDADARARHVWTADRAVHIGPAPAVDSYLSIPRVIAAARECGADAVHPGYGFLSENPAFAAACEESGLTFVGPPSDVIARTGSKIEARALMDRAGVPTVPGRTPADQSDDSIRQAALHIGLPVLIKASAGGGGKGMRRVDEATGLVAAAQAARREAIAAFGDGTLYVERLIQRPRHVEVQVFGDHHGRIIHLFERECSVQRRHQKVIEESPSPVLSATLRGQLTDAAVRAASACGYRNAGTIEFIVDPGGADGGRFYFLEMNTRLQVEHPVTEQVTGVDLVRAQLLVAAGAPLPWDSPPNQRGHAIEARVYAEDPGHDFLPQAGRILLYREPRRPGVRVDSGVGEGDEVPVHYDPLLAKVIATAETRRLTIDRLADALRHFPVLGIRTNIPFLLRILDHDRFRSGEVDTTFLDNEGSSLSDEGARPVPDFVSAAAAAHNDYQDSAGSTHGVTADPWRRLGAWRA